MVLRTEICAAARSLVHSIVRADIADTGAQFEVPPLAEDPLVAVAYTRSVIPAFVSGTAAVPEEIERGAYIPDIEFASVDMEAEEVAVEFLAEPVARFRLYEKMFPPPR